ncbi:hypothetical protein JOQ06_022199 [Pogonophryne albipinna]|uniref:6-phosphogluconate dehydrogenase NADP-binding domain-containing protein n=1 Tax=Pogonophryne albipinna TaxID=1090488 RepID=A0AAD6F2S3_9TELE|nr:hypothetical protein JOQ06_022199 [Pogonophryne albipinna]
MIVLTSSGPHCPQPASSMEPISKRLKIIEEDTGSTSIQAADSTAINGSITPTDKRIGFLGLGLMGSGIVSNLLKMGHVVTVWNRTAEKCDLFTQEGARLGRTPAEVASTCDITFSCVSDPKAARDLVMGTSGVLQGMRPGNCYVEMSTVDPETITEISQWYQGYYEFIRPEFVRGECNCFFLSARGTKITSGSSDLNRLHESCGLKRVSRTSGQVRRAAETLVATSFTEKQKQNVAAYMCHSDLMADKHYRMPVPSTIVATAVLLDTLPGYTPERYLPTETDSPGSCMSEKEFSDFQKTFPVSRDCQPPTKKQRVDAGFSENRVYYDRWRKCQYADRQEHLLSYYTYQKPSCRKMERLISKEGWTSNCPKAQDILDMWTPALKYVIASDKHILNSCSRQKWKGLVIKSFDGQKGEGVVATTNFTKGDIVCDYHGKVITKAHVQYGVNRKSFRGQALDLDWLDE